MDDYPIFEDIFWPQKGDGVSVSLQLFLFEVLIYVTNGLKVFLSICTVHSVRKKKVLPIQNIALFSRPVAAPPSNHKNCGVQPYLRVARGNMVLPGYAERDHYKHIFK